MRPPKVSSPRMPKSPVQVVHFPPASLARPRLPCETPKTSNSQQQLCETRRQGTSRFSTLVFSTSMLPFPSLSGLSEGGQIFSELGLSLGGLGHQPLQPVETQGARAKQHRENHTLLSRSMGTPRSSRSESSFASLQTLRLSFPPCISFARSTRLPMLSIEVEHGTFRQGLGGLPGHLCSA